MKSTKIIILSLIFFALLATHTHAAPPSSTNYTLNEFGFGSGGTNNSTSTNFGLFGLLGDMENNTLSSTNYKALSGLTYTLQANTPPAPTFTNPSNYYNQLHLTINQGNNPQDTTYAIAISTDNFVSETNYIQNDNTIGTVLGSEDWQTYTSWGGASGITLVGLSPSTTYTVKIKSYQGKYTQTGFGPTTQASTTTSTLSFDIDIASSDTDTDPPFTLNIGTLTAGSVITSTNKIWIDLSTNGTAGGIVYVYGANSGLSSATTSETISSATTNLATVGTGYGARSNSVSQASGGPMQASSPYNGASDNVGVLDTSKRIIFDSSSQPVTAGRTSFEIKAKANQVTAAADDYSDTLTIITTAAF